MMGFQRPRTREGVVLALLLCQIAFVVVPPVSANSQPSEQPWLYQQFRFRVEIVVSNNQGSDLTSYPILTQIDFPVTHLLSGVLEIRLVDQRGSEVPSYVVDERASGGFVTSALLVMFVSMKASANESYWVYYGDVAAGMQAYRRQQNVDTIGSGLLSVLLSSKSDESALGITFGNTYFQTLTSKISYGSSQRLDYGNSLIANSPFAEVSGWHTFENMSHSSVSLSAASFQAGNVTYAPTVIASNSSVTLFELVSNSGSSTIQDVRLTQVVNDSELAKLGETLTQYDKATGTVLTSASGATLGLASRPSPQNVEIANQSRLTSDARAGKIVSQNSAVGPSAAALVWSVGDLPAGGSVIVKEKWAISSDSKSLAMKLQDVGASPVTEVGAEEQSHLLEPVATGLWNATISLADTLLPASGTSIPLKIATGVVLPGRITLGGTISYTEPPANFSQGSLNDWFSSSLRTGNATAFSSQTFWSVEKNRYVGRISLVDPDTNSGGTASLLSVKGEIQGSGDAHLIVKYRAALRLVQGDPSSQLFYAAVDLDHQSVGKFDQTLLLPVTGSATTVNETSCGASRIIRPASPAEKMPKTTQVGYLIGDDTWRTLDLDLGEWIRSSGAQFDIRFCASTAGPFSGSLEMRIESAGITVVAPAQNFFEATINSVSPSISVSLRRGSVITAPEITARLAIGFSIASSLLMNQTHGAEFTSPLPKPSIAMMNEINDSRSSLSNSFQGLVLYTPFSHLNPHISMSGLQAEGVVTLDGSIFVAGRPFNSKVSENSGQSREVSLLFGGDSLAVSITDANNNPVTGAIVGVTALGFGRGVTELTDSYGRTQFYLLPSNYTLSVEFQGALVSTSDINLRANQTLTIEAKVYQIAIKVSDALGHPIGDADLLLSNGRDNLTGTSDAKGMFATQVAANEVYRLRVKLGGNQYYHGNLTASANNAVVSISASYYPVAFQTEIGTAIAAVLLVTGVVLYFPRRFSGALRKAR